MIKATTKFLRLALLGLLIPAVTLFYAFPTHAEDKESSGAHGVPFQDAWEFMKDNTEEYSRFVQDFGENKKGKRSIYCGAFKCNMSSRTCLKKDLGAAPAEGEKTNQNYMSFGSSSNWGQSNSGAFNNNWLASKGMPYFDAENDFAMSVEVDMPTNYVELNPSTTRVKYLCVPQSQKDKYLQKGYSEVEDAKITEEELAKDEKCYKAKKKTAAQGDRLAPKLEAYCVKVIDDTVEVKSSTDDKQGECPVIPVAWYNNKECTFCKMMGGIYAASENLTEISRANFARSFAITIVLGMAIWIAIKTLSFVSSMTKQDAAKYITEMIKQSYKFMIAFFALAFYDDVFIYIIRPLLAGGLHFGTSFVEVQSVEARFEIEDMQELINSADKLPSDYSRNLNNRFYDFPTYVLLENLAYNINLQYTLLQTIGRVLVCRGFEYMLDLSLGLGFASVIYGSAFAAFGFFLCLAFIFYLLDAIVQLGIVGGLLPFLIASWPFKITSKYTSTGFKMLLNSIFTFMMMGVVAEISMELINKAVELNTQPTAETAGGSSDFKGLVEAIDTIDTRRLQEMVNVLSVGFLLFMFANIMGFLLLTRVSELVNRFASGGMKPSAPSLATMGASQIKGMAGKVAAPTMNAIGEKMSKAGESIGKGIAKGTGAVANKAFGMATLRPVRRWGMKKFNQATEDGSIDKALNKITQKTGRAIAGAITNPVRSLRKLKQKMKGKKNQPTENNQNRSTPPTLGGNTPSTPPTLGNGRRPTRSDMGDMG